jgi:hypothetical protein
MFAPNSGIMRRVSQGDALDENVALVSRGCGAGELDFLELLLMHREMLEARREDVEALAALRSCLLARIACTSMQSLRSGRVSRAVASRHDASLP